MNIIKKIWIEVIVFGSIFGILLIDCAKKMTWINTDSDGIHDTYSAVNLYIAHHTTMPLYLLTGHFFTLIPIGTPFFRMTLLSILSCLVGCIFIYLIIRYLLKENKSSRWYAILGVLIYGGSALVISQATIPNEKTVFVTMFLIASYYFSIRKQWKLTALMLGLGLAVHLLAFLFIIPLYLVNKELRRWKYIGITLACCLFYLYIPLSVYFHPEQPNMWGNKSLVSTLTDLLATFQMLFGSLAIYDLPKRILDASGVIIVSLGLGIIGIIYYFIKNQKKKSILFWLFMLPIIMYVIGLPPQTYVYIIPSIAIGSVIAVLALSKMSRMWVVCTFVAALTLLNYNAHYFRIGVNLDPNYSANEYYTTELEKVPDGQVLLPYYGWQWAAIYPYNKENNRNIIAINPDGLVNPIYQGQLKEQGIKLQDNLNPDRSTRQDFIARSIIDLNENVWTTRTTTPETYGCEVILAKGHEDIFTNHATEPPGQIHWKPSNPYDIITGAIEITQWGYLTMSNWSVLFFMSLACAGLLLNWLFYKIPNRNKKKNVYEED